MARPSCFILLRIFFYLSLSIFRKDSFNLFVENPDLRAVNIGLLEIWFKQAPFSRTQSKKLTLSFGYSLLPGSQTQSKYLAPSVFDKVGSKRLCQNLLTRNLFLIYSKSLSSGREEYFRHLGGKDFGSSWEGSMGGEYSRSLAYFSYLEGSNGLHRERLGETGVDLCFILIMY